MQGTLLIGCQYDTWYNGAFLLVATSALLKNQLSSCKQTQLEYIKDETKIDER